MALLKILDSPTNVLLLNNMYCTLFLHIQNDRKKQTSPLKKTLKKASNFRAFLATPENATSMATETPTKRLVQPG